MKRKVQRPAEPAQSHASASAIVVICLSTGARLEPTDPTTLSPRTRQRIAAAMARFFPAGGAQ